MEKTIDILLKQFLCGQASPEDVARLKEEFAQRKAETSLANFYEEAWRQADFTPEKEGEERVWAKLEKQTDKATQISKPLSVRLTLPRKILRIAAIILIPLLCAGLGYYYAVMPSQSDNKMIVQVEIGQKAKVQLPDGTFVWLNSAGSLAYDNSYNKKERLVYLEGEAYFEVNKDKKRPFIVKANDISVEALGTKFNVKAYPTDEYVTATLLEGSVRVESPVRSCLLKPNERVIISKKNGRFTKAELPDAGKNIMWINNQLAFEQERLEDIAKVLERMYNVHIRFASDKLKEVRFSGVINNNNLENVLQLIDFVSPIRYSIEKDGMIIIREK